MKTRRLTAQIPVNSKINIRVFLLSGGWSNALRIFRSPHPYQLSTKLCKDGAYTGTALKPSGHQPAGTAFDPHGFLSAAVPDACEGKPILDKAEEELIWKNE